MPGKQRDIPTLRQRENQRIRINTIVEKLPMYCFLNHSQSVLLRLQAAWTNWCHDNIAHCDSEIANSPPAQLTSLHNGCLLISAKNSAVASFLKHQQHRILQTLNAEASKHINKPKPTSPNTKKESDNNLLQPLIERIKVRIDLDAFRGLDKFHQHLHRSQTISREKPDTASIDALKQLQKIVRNPALAESLGRLAKTLSSK